MVLTSTGYGLHNMPFSSFISAAWRALLLSFVKTDIEPEIKMPQALASTFIKKKIVVVLRKNRQGHITKAV